jgi:hypothetical protein
MKTIRVVALGLMLASLGGAFGYAEPGNACVYRYSFSFKDPSGYADSFSFCLTAYGTLASLQSPLGTEHMDPNNPLEGFTIYDQTDSVPVDLVILPGFEATQSPYAVVQPKGSGKLPIVFTYKGGSIGNTDTITVTANPSEKTVVFTMTVGKYVFQYNAGSGQVSRIAGLFVDGLDTDVFANSGYSGFSYNPEGHGVMISGSFCAPPKHKTCGEIQGAVSNNYEGYGQDVVVGEGYFYTLGESTDVFTYRVF